MPPTASRHPLCPSCGYDLVATVQARRRICPECGSEFDRSDLRYERRPGDWSLAAALRLSLRTLAIRSALSAALWFAGTAIMVVVIPRGGLAGLLVLLTAIILGCLIGWAFSRDLFESAGFDSVILIVAACAGAALAVAAGQVMVEVLIGLFTPAARGLLVCAALTVAWTWIIKVTLTDLV